MLIVRQHQDTAISATNGQVLNINVELVCAAINSTTSNWIAIMEESFISNHDANFENTKWFLENLVNEYKVGFESLKSMLPFCRSKLGTPQMDHFEYEIACVEANIAQNEVHYKTLNSIYLESFVTAHNEQPDLSAANCVPLPSIEPSYSQQIDPNGNFNCELPSLVDSGDVMNNEKLSLSSIDYMFSVDSSDDFFELIKAEDSSNVYGRQPTSCKSDQENQDQSCMLVSINGDRQTTDIVKPEKANTSKMRSATSKHSKSTSSALKKSRLNECRIWYKCGWEGCSFGSYYNGVVKRHSLKRHSGKIKIDKSSNSSMHRFKCDWPGCEVSLVAYHKLVEHKRKHTGEKPFRCKWKSCNYATARLYSMIIHERTHKLDPFAE